MAAGLIVSMAIYLTDFFDFHNNIVLCDFLSRQNEPTVSAEQLTKPDNILLCYPKTSCKAASTKGIESAWNAVILPVQ